MHWSNSVTLSGFRGKAVQGSAGKCKTVGIVKFEESSAKVLVQACARQRVQVRSSAAVVRFE